jgi:hypothetical protein
MTNNNLPAYIKVILLALTLMLTLAACAPDDPVGTPHPLEGGLLATFEVHGDEFRVWVTNPATIQQILDLQAGEADANIPNGLLQTGPGQGEHNAPYDWHLHPEDIEMAEMTMEVCDATPSYVEENLDEFMQFMGGRYCPWAAQLVNVQDYR